MNQATIRPLATEFTKDQFVHRCLKREGFAALYERWHETNPAGRHFEVVEVLERAAPPGYKQGHKEMEVYPTHTAWGRFGWTYRDREAAEAKYAWLKARIAEREAKRNEQAA